MLRRSRRLAGLPPNAVDVDTHVIKEEEVNGIFQTHYEWAAFVVFAFILPVYYFTAFQ